MLADPKRNLLGERRCRVLDLPGASVRRIGHARSCTPHILQLSRARR
jgi:hypothetical protein